MKKIEIELSRFGVVDLRTVNIDGINYRVPYGDSNAIFTALCDMAACGVSCEYQLEFIINNWERI